ncbi:Protein croquemort [Eumeta japonica]|uniref:Protein croquemort n=1 Tax=Eumeta variegata TaxID=151549 RepID=A0A4C1S8R3_EUMVA|nr:Protein croquemort [Eumeta japonica]
MISSAWKSGLLLGFGAVFVVVGAIMMVFWPPLFFNELKKMMVLTNESMSYDMWRETPIPMYLECFMFNITNAHEILEGNGDVKPKVEQLGPYTFRETHTKVNITWNDNSTVSYYNQRWWHFEPEMSNGSLSDVITSLNPVVATVTYMLRYRRPLTIFAVNAFLLWRHEHMFINANVSDWLFDGIDDSLLEIAHQFPELGFDVPYDRFGWFYERKSYEMLDQDGTHALACHAPGRAGLCDALFSKNLSSHLLTNEN